MPRRQPDEISVLDFGAKGDGSDDRVAIQQAIDYADQSDGPRKVIFPFAGGSFYGIGDELMVRGDRGTMLEGVARPGSVRCIEIRALSDFGTGQYMIRPLAGTFAQQGWGLRNLSLRGPGGDRVLGTVPCNMDGLLIAARFNGEGLNISRCRSGIVWIGDHQSLRDSVIGTCYYGIYFKRVDAAEQHTAGDRYLENVTIDNNALASVGIKDDAETQGTWWIKCHFTAAPFHFYGESAAAESHMMLAMGFWGCGAESSGNGFAYSDGNRSIGDVDFGGLWGYSTVYDSAHYYSGKSRNAVIDVYSMGNVLHEMVGGHPEVTANQTGMFRVTQRVVKVELTRMDGALNQCAINAKPLFVDYPAAATGDGVYITWDNVSFAGSGRAIVRRANGSIGLAEVVEIDTGASNFQVKQAAASSTIPIGVAVSHSTAAGHGVAVSLPGSIVRVRRTGTINRGDYVRMSATAGKAEAASGFSDTTRPVLGIAVDNGGNNATYGGDYVDMLQQAR
jgi:hypothetical protein